MNDKIDQWICFIDDSNKEAVKMAEKNNVVLKKARKELNYLTGDAAVRRMAELREKWEMDEIAVKKNAERIGRKEGNVEGRMAKKKVYAVKKGKQTGLFYSWNECKESVSGYPGAEYKGFETEEEAKNYLENRIQEIKKVDIEENTTNQLVVYVDGSFE